MRQRSFASVTFPALVSTQISCCLKINCLFKVFPRIFGQYFIKFFVNLIEAFAFDHAYSTQLREFLDFLLFFP